MALLKNKDKVDTYMKLTGWWERWKKKKKNNKENQWLQIVKTFIEEVNTQGDRDKLGRPI